MSFVICSCKTGKWWNQNVFTNWQNFVKFYSNPLTCDPTLFSGKSSPNIGRSNCIFSGKERGDRALILTYLDSLITKFFHRCCLSFSISVIFRGKRVVQVGRKLETLGPSLFRENLNPSNFFQTMFLLTRVLPLVRISAILDYIWGSKGPKISQKEPFHGCWIGTQNFENS